MESNRCSFSGDVAIDDDGLDVAPLYARTNLLAPRQIRNSWILTEQPLLFLNPHLLASMSLRH